MEMLNNAVETAVQSMSALLNDLAHAHFGMRAELDAMHVVMRGVVACSLDDPEFKLRLSAKLSAAVEAHKNAYIYSTNSDELADQREAWLKVVIPTELHDGLF